MLTLAALNASMVEVGRGFGLGQDHAHALRAFEQLDDHGRATHFLDHVDGALGIVRESGNGKVDAGAGEDLQRAQLVAGPADRDALVQGVDALHLELAQHGETIVGDRCADAGDDRVVERQAQAAVMEDGLRGGDVHVHVQGIDDVDGVAAAARGLDQSHVRVEARVAGEHDEAQGHPANSGSTAAGCGDFGWLQITGCRGARQVRCHDGAVG